MLCQRVCRVKVFSRTMIRCQRLAESSIEISWIGKTVSLAPCFFFRPALVYSQTALLKSKAVLVWSAKASPGSIGFDACIGLGITCGIMWQQNCLASQVLECGHQWYSVPSGWRHSWFERLIMTMTACRSSCSGSLCDTCLQGTNVTLCCSMA